MTESRHRSSRQDPEGSFDASARGSELGQAAGPAHTRVYRHPLIVRITHWINLFCLILLLMSGLQIFNAHPALYWGSASDFANPLIVIGPEVAETGEQIGAFRIFDKYMFETTGVLGLSGDGDARAFPGWATLPSPQWLAMGRHWHFTAAWIFILNGLVYLGYSLVSGHLRRRLLPTGRQIRHVRRTVLEHVRLRFPKGEEARHYNVLQKLAYLVALVLLGPAMILTGLTMSPNMNAAAPWLLELFGGRQSARTIHFLAALGLVIFVIVHVGAVLFSGVWNNLRSMLTGRYVIKGERDER